MKLLQINTTLNTTSTGRITEGIGKVMLNSGHQSFAGYRKIGPAGTESIGIKIGDEIDRYLHGIKTRIMDLHGFGSERATIRFISEVEKIDPDIIGMHNLHGYYLNIEVLFNYLKEVPKPVVWTLHDCWPFTGHCAFFDYVGCEKWKSECHKCPLKNKYPASYVLDNSKWNYGRKKELFNGVENLTIVTPSQWLADLVSRSFLKEYTVEVIHNGIDLNTFCVNPPESPGVDKLNEKCIVLGVASIWDRRKGLDDFLELRKILETRYQIVLVGLEEKQIKYLPDGITGIARTENVEQLAALYSAAEVFVNPTWSDNFPTTNIEALACGTPVITYETGGSPEAIDKETGMVVKQGSVEGLRDAITHISEKENKFYRKKCRSRAVACFNKEERFRDYLKLYEKVIN